MRRAYVLALGLVAVLSVGAFVLLHGFIAMQGESASIINVAGKQRMLSQRIAGLAQAVVLGEERDSVQRDKALLEAAADEMESAHRQLMAGSDERNLPGIQSEAERAYYDEAPHRIDARVQAFIADANALLVERDRERQVALAAGMASVARAELLGALNAVVGFHETQARANAGRAEAVHLGLLVATIVTLICEGLFIFSPLARELVSKERIVARKQEELSYRSFRDQLTGLFNRHYLHVRADAHTGSERRLAGPDGGFSLIAIDIDNFKDVNDANGHEAGDRLLVLVADLIRSTLGTDDLAVRVGGDEFLIVVRSSDTRIARRTAERLHERTRRALSLEPGCAAVAASFGIASAPQHGLSLDEVHTNADIALYHAKSTGKNAVVEFAEPLRESFDERRKAETTVREALLSSAFEPFFQPQVDMRTGEITGVEALARCRGADGSWLAPNQFLPVAEETGLIVPLGEQIMAKAIRAASDWLAQGSRFGRLSLNASATQLLAPDFIRFLESTLAEHGFPHDCLSIEILETVLIDDDDDRIVDIVRQIRALGIGVELDDFGTGYTSIANVNRLKVDRIKIDRSFIQAIGSGLSGLHVLRAILTMAESMGVEVIAEGIETTRQQEKLLSYGCSAGQGFLFAKPMSGQDMSKRLTESALSPRVRRAS